ncbi:type VI secretion system membrane subunit TssM [Aurantivibrio infirmus]
MSRFFAFISQGWLLALLGIILLSLIIWFIGPLVAISDYKPLASENIRLATIFIAFILWGLNNLRVRNKSQKTEQAFAKNLMAEETKETKDSKKDKNDRVKTQDEEVLAKRLNDAIRMLQSSKVGKKGKLYTLPWYMIIGVPGSGKTTALKNSGLHFPLRSKLGDEPVQGAGGTRYCDWWFTDEAILIDTAGRYTSQDNPKKVETHAWLGFLSSLKKMRPKRPLNGIILTISMQDVLQKTATQKGIQTTAIKQRIQELNNHLGMELPVYVVFTKTDMVAGFNSFFADLEQDELKQAWGFTFPDTRAEKTSDLLGQFNEEYDVLMQRINSRVLNRLNHEKNQQRRTLVYEFPRQMNSLRTQLHEFLTNIFIPNQFEPPFLLRGVYFVSSTQTNMASQWVSGILPPDQCAPPVDIVSKEPKTFFVNKLLNEIIFPEANMATVNAKAKYRYQWIYRSALAISTFAFAGMLVAWENSRRLNNSYIENLDQQVQQYKNVTNDGLENDHDWLTLAAGLNELKGLTTGFDEGSDRKTLQQGLGLYQGDKLGSQAQLTYLKSLESFFMNDLGNMLSRQISTAKNDDERLYEALKFYLMQYYSDKMDQETFVTWVNVLWARILPGDSNQVLREHLNTHLMNALNNQVAPAPIDQQLVDSAREILIRTPLEERVYRHLKNDYLSRNKDQYSIQDVLGKKAEVIFYRPSGKPLSEGIPTLFTYEGFHTGFNVQNKTLAQDLAKEQWIYGDSVLEPLNEEEIKRITESVNEQYFTEYNARWGTLIEDLKIKSFSTVNRGQAVLRLLASSDTPLIKVLESIRKNTALSEAPAVSGAATELASNINSQITSNKKDRLERLVPESLSVGSIRLPGHAVTENFDALNTYINLDDGLPLQQLQQSLKGLNEYFQTLAFAGNLKQAAFQSSLDSEEGSSSTTTVRRAIAESPREIQQWFNSITRDTNRVTAAATQGHMNNVWQTDVLSFFNQALKDRYPINPKSDRDIKRADFTKFFGPEGIIQEYFRTNIEPFVDSSQTPWRWKKNIGLAESSLRFFERAQRINTAYFSESATSPEVNFSLRPHALDGVVIGFLLETGGNSLRYNNGPPTTTKLTWPGSDGELSKITFTLASGGTPISARAEGEWSWFRLLDNHAKQENQNNSDAIKLTFYVNSVKAEYDLLPQSAFNPFGNKDLQNLTLPDRL